MGKLGKRIAIGVGVFVGGVGIALGAFLGVTPYAPPAPDLHVAGTAEQIERGRYLAEHVSHCTTCHSEPDHDRFSSPPREGGIGAGGHHWGAEDGVPFEVWSANITPSGVGDWTDGELARAITIGVDDQGDALVPLMPYGNYRNYCQEDVESIVAWTRTLQPIEHEVPEAEIPLPLALLLRTLPTEAEPWPCPQPGDAPEVRGRYLVRVAGCADCHTRREGIEQVGAPFAGGNEMVRPEGVYRTANLTPDEETGLGRWTEEGFVARFRAHREAAPVRPGDFNSPMPWNAYSGMSDEDLGAIYAFLRTQEPARNPIERFTPTAEHVASR